MIASPQRQFMSPEAYLEWEPLQECRYEYIDGEVLAMTGGTKPHNRVAANLFTALDQHLGGRCEVYIADVKVQVTAKGPYHYPDVVVSCDQRDQNTNQVICYPCLIAEVLSPSTEAIDRGKKFRQYRQAQSLQEYVLIQADQKGVDCFRKNEAGLWVMQSYEAEDELWLETVDLTLPVEALYRQVRFDEPEPNPKSLSL
ncbi:MAG: Uma2 family endonuclease [Oculatellaceae cyanobacterium Prado106]|jgi:Uma2 family endonuclease|nr:Uma2 family endonuclease [Oculatellaceae cyanobacterium Prado106]